MTAERIDVTGTMTISPTGTITQNAGSTLYAGAIVQAGGTVNGTLQNQTTFTYQSGLFNGRLLNQGTAILGPSFTAGNGVENDASMTVNLGQTLTMNGQGLDNRGNFTLAGGTLNGDGPLVNNSVLTGRGTIAGGGGFANNGYVAVSGGTMTLSNSGTQFKRRTNRRPRRPAIAAHRRKPHEYRRDLSRWRHRRRHGHAQQHHGHHQRTRHDRQSAYERRFARRRWRHPQRELGFQQ